MGKQFEKLFLETEYGRGKSMENVLLIISNVYNFKVSVSFSNEIKIKEKMCLMDFVSFM